MLDRRDMQMGEEMLCKEYNELVRRGNWSKGDLDTLHTVVATMKDLKKIEVMDEEGGYSGDGMWEARGDYARGNSYDYSRRRNAMGRYSRGYYPDDGMNPTDRADSFNRDMRW